MVTNSAAVDLSTISVSSLDGGEGEIVGHAFYVVCWRGSGRSVNVMCGKVDIERIKHQLEALSVFRPKVMATTPVQSGSTASTTSLKLTELATDMTVEAVEDILIAASSATN